MSVEKKSLISRRAAAKKAIVTKPEATTVSATKVKHFKVASNRLEMPRVSPAHASKVKF